MFLSGAEQRENDKKQGGLSLLLLPPRGGSLVSRFAKLSSGRSSLGKEQTRQCGCATSFSRFPVCLVVQSFCVGSPCVSAPRVYVHLSSKQTSSVCTSRVYVQESLGIWGRRVQRHQPLGSTDNGKSFIIG